MQEATHVRVIQTIAIDTGEGVQVHEYGYWFPSSDGTGAIWRSLGFANPLPLTVGANTSRLWAANDGYRKGN